MLVCIRACMLDSIGLVYLGRTEFPKSFLDLDFGEPSSWKFPNK